MSSGATDGIWCMVRVTMSAARKRLHGNEFSGIRTADRGARSEDRGTQILGEGFERQYRGRDQAAAIEEPGIDQQHFCEPLALANHAVGASSSASLYARLRLHDFHRLA